MKKSAAWPWTHLNQSARIRVGLGCKKQVSGVWLKNVQNPPSFDRGTKMFRLLGSSTFSDGPWKRLIGNLLEDSRKKPPKVKTLMFDKPLVLRYLKFELVEYWGLGGGLQYFEPIFTDTPVKDSGTTDCLSKAHIYWLWLKNFLFLTCSFLF